MKFIDKTGRRFGLLVALDISHRETVTGSPRIFWRCRCDCGVESVVCGLNLHDRPRGTKSCGCAKEARKVTHGMSKRREYRIWGGMIQRCTNPNADRFADYGGRGITVCAEWLEFDAFFRDMGPRPGAHLSIDRIDNDQGYRKENCKWSTRSEQQLNKRTSKKCA